MRNLVRFSLSLACLATGLSWAAAQPPAAKPADDPKVKDYSNAPLVVKMMAFDKKKDGKLTRDEITDERLLRLFDMADTNKDGFVTKEELMALAAKLDADAPRGGGPGGPRGDGDNPPPPRGDRQPPGAGGPGGPGGGPDGPPGPGGPGGPGGRFGPPKPGTILPAFVVEQLKLTDDQKKQLDDLQKEVDVKLDKILTADQKQMLQDLRPGRGPGGPGGPGRGGPGGPDGPGRGGPGGPGGPDGPPPGGPGRPGPDRDR
ncbi:MAG TPA: hypothetical protein VMS17_09680 [Gemmataceae bacterium]|nr:hypothetical protein [Gemmataceae bacterium]